MKETSVVRYVLRLTLNLLLITGVVAVALAGVNAITKDRIAQAKAAKTLAAVEAVLPGGGQAVEENDPEILALYKGDAGFAVEVSPNGFGGQIHMMVGIDHSGNVTAISIISHAETPSLGAVAAENSSKGIAFRDQFAGLSDTASVGSEIDAITGATITSKAVTDGVNKALEFAKTLG